MARKRNEKGRYSGMKDSSLGKDNSEFLRQYQAKRREEKKEALKNTKKPRVQLDPLKKYGREKTNKLNNILKVKEGEDHEKWLSRTAKYRLKTEEEHKKTSGTIKVHKIYSSSLRKEVAEKKKKIVEARFISRPKLFIQYLFALLPYFEAKHGIDKYHFMFILYLDSLERPFSYEEFNSKCEAFDVRPGSFSEWKKKNFVIDIGKVGENHKNTGMYRVHKDVSLLCYWFYEYLSGDKMVLQLKGDKENKTSINTMLIDMKEEMSYFFEGLKKPSIALKLDENGNLINL